MKSKTAWPYLAACIGAVGIILGWTYCNEPLHTTQQVPARSGHQSQPSIAMPMEGMEGAGRRERVPPAGREASALEPTLVVEVVDERLSALQDAEVSVGRGTVRKDARPEDLVRGQPVGGAKTGSNGRASFDLDTGDYTLLVAARGFGLWVDSIQLAPGRRSEVRVVLTRGVTVFGTARSADGRPVANVHVAACFVEKPPQAYTDPYARRGRQLGMPTSRSDAGGEYRLDGLPAGELVIEAELWESRSGPFRVPSGRAVMKRSLSPARTQAHR